MPLAINDYSLYTGDRSIYIRVNELVSVHNKYHREIHSCIPGSRHFNPIAGTEIASIQIEPEHTLPVLNCCTPGSIS